MVEGSPVKTKVLVTGGAGYIGSHTVKVLIQKGYEVLIVDNFSTGRKELLVKGTKLEVCDCGDYRKMSQIVKDFLPDVVIHFAAFIVVPESVEKPLKYYENNVVQTLILLKVLKENGIKNFIFSSSAAVYGIPRKIPVPEEEPLKPISPYGHSKAMIEQVLKDMSHSGDINYISLRYFNVTNRLSRKSCSSSSGRPSGACGRPAKDI